MNDPIHQYKNTDITLWLTSTHVSHAASQTRTELWWSS